MRKTLSSLRGGLCVLAMWPAIAMAGPTPIVADDLYRLADLAEPAFSPDGGRIVYSVTTSDRTLDKETSDLWAVPWRGGAAIRLTATAKTSESEPRFSMDGRTILFLSDAGAPAKKGAEGAGNHKRDEDANTQLWSMPAAGGAARRITSLPGGITDYALSPDGGHAVVVAEVGHAVGQKADTPPPVEIDRFYFKQDHRGYLDDRTQQLFVVDLATGAARQITSGARDHWHPAWSPDGKWIAYTAKDQGEADRTLNYDIYIVAPEGGTPKRISNSANADDDPDWEGGISWSPDSRRLVWLEAGEDKWIYYSPPQLTIADIATGAVTRPAQIDRWFYKPRFAPDGTILALVEQDRDTWLARIDPTTGTLAYLTSGKKFATDFAIGRDGRVALLQGDSRTPAELYALADSRPLTHSNDWLASRTLGEVRDVAFQSGAAEIHGYVTLPGDGAAAHLPLIVDLHGGPVYQHSHEFDFKERVFAGAGYGVLAVNPRGSSGRGFDFSRAIYADWGHLDVQDISAGIGDAIASGIADPARIGVGGWSYGGILTDYMIASDTRIKAAVSGAGVGNVLATFGVDMYAREYLLELGAPWEHFETYRKLAYPFLEAQRITAPTLFECAGADDNVPCPGAQQMYLALKTRGVPTHLIVYPGENHELAVPSYRLHRLRSDVGWYDRWLKNGAAGGQ